VFGFIALWRVFAPAAGETLTVSTTSEAINGDTSSPAALVKNPGPDGISLVEAMVAAEATTGYDTIRFDPSLSGSVITITNGLPQIFQGNLTIDGDIDDDTHPDITIDGASAVSDDGFFLYGASRVVIKGLFVRGFRQHGISVSPNTGSGAATVRDLVFYRNTISSAWNAVELIIWNQDHAAIRNVEIVANNLQNSGGGVGIHAGMGDSAMDNEISGVSIISNTIVNPGNHIGGYRFRQRLRRVYLATPSSISRSVATESAVTPTPPS
jgi:hypothetical protein